MYFEKNLQIMVFWFIYVPHSVPTLLEFGLYKLLLLEFSVH